MAKSPIDNIINKNCDCPEDTINMSSGNSIIDIPASKCSPPQEVIINYGNGGITEVGDIIQGDNVILSGNLIGRLVGLGDIIISTISPDLSNYYTKTELQTSGQSSVHWNNITNVPDLSVLWENIIGNQSSVEVGGFSNTIGYITLADLPPSTNTLQEVLTNGDTATRGAYFNIEEYTAWGGNTVISIGDEDLVNDANLSVGMRVANTSVPGVYVDIGVLGIQVFEGVNRRALLSSTSVGLIGSSGAIRFAQLTSGELGISGLGDYNLLRATFQNRAGVVAYLDDIPDLTGYATELWVTSQGYLTSVPWSFDVNNGDLTINGITNNLDGRWLEKAEGVITEGYGIIVNGDLATGMGIEVNTTTLDARYLRKDVNDNNSTFSLTLGGLVSETATVQSTLTLASLATGSTSDSFLTITSGGVVQKVTLPSGGGPFTVANNSGVSQFTVAPGDTWRFNATGDASIAFNAGTKTITINSSGGSSGGGVDSFNARTGAVVPEAGDYTTTLVDEGINLYFTQARVRSTPLTGYTVGANTAILATDTILQAFGKAQGQINSRVSTARTLTVDGTAGNITVSGGTFDLSANRTWTVNLANKGTAGTYTKVTTDAQGRVVSGDSLSLGDMPSGVLQTLSNGNWGQMGYLAISGGNDITVNSISSAITTTGTAQDMLDTKWSLSSTSGLLFYSYGSGSSGFNGSLGSGIMTSRYSGTTAKTGFLIDRPTAQDDKLYYANIAGNGVLRSWQTFASESWVNSVLPTDYISTSGNQTGLSGNKTTSGTWSFSGPTSVPIIVERTGTGANSSIQYTTTAGNIYVGQGAANTFSVGSNANLSAEAWLNVSSSGMTYASANNTSVNAPVNGFVFSRNVNGGYMQGGGSSTTSWTLRGYATSGVQLALNDGGVDIPIGTSNTTSGYYIGGNVVLGANSNYTLLSAPTTSGIVYLYPNGRGSATGRWIITPTDVTISSLTGSGTQMIVADASGVLSRQAIPAVGVTSVATGAHLTGGTITSTGTISLVYDVNVYANDSQGNPRLYFGNVASTYGVIIRASDTNHTFDFRNSANNTVWSIGSTGALVVGTVPWARITGAPTIPTVNNGTLTMTTGSGLTGSASFTANQSGNSTFTVGLSQATATTIGGIEIFSNTVQSVAANAVSSTASRTYGIQLNSAGQAVVNVPWTNTNTTYSDGNGLTLTGNVFSLTAINAGSTVIGAVRYNGTTQTAGSWYGGTAAPSQTTRLNYSGILHAYDMVSYGSSDIRLKENIKLIENPIKKLSQIGGYSFKWKEGHDSYSGEDYGLIAQEVEKILPEIVIERGGIKAIKTGNQLTGLLIEAVKELNKRLETLEQWRTPMQ